MRLTVFSKIAEINPRVKLQKGNEYPYVEMIEVEPNRRYVYGVQSREYKGGGTKFIDGDTIFARITPCLENGKIAQFVNSKQIGFGSTEFFVFRAKPGISDPNFIYYLSRSDMIKNPAEKSMSGASGRQRADIKSVINIEVPDFSLSTQCKIAAILSAYDDLIENNLRRIKILEEMAQNLYREWFVNFRFPGHENTRFVDSPLGKIPEGWEVSMLGDHLSTLESGKRPKGGIQGNCKGIPSVGAENVRKIGRHNYQSEKYIPKSFYEEMKKGKVKHGDVALYKDGAYIGRSTYFRDNFPHPKFCVNEHVFILRSNGNKLTQNILYLWLQESSTIAYIRSTNANAAQPGINQKGVRGLKIIIASKEIANDFDELVEPLLALIISLAKKNNILRQTRDLLLPKLISGEVDVSELDIKVPEEAVS